MGKLFIALLSRFTGIRKEDGKFGNDFQFSGASRIRGFVRPHTELMPHGRLSVVLARP